MRFWDHPDHLFARSTLAVAAIVCVAPAFAQNTTSAIAGRVVDDAGRPVAGAQVNIRHIESGTVNTATTDAEGRYTARGLRAGGPYTITVTAGGRSERQEGIVLALAETLPLETRIAAQAVQQVVVTGAATNQRFSASNMGAGTTLNNTAVTALPSVQRNLQDLARLDPRIAQTDKDRGEISALGQNSRFNSITIDGVSTNDPFGLESNNLPMLKQPVSMDVIQAVQINVSNFDVTQKGYTGANINAVTKSGGNEFKGSAYYVFRNQDLSGNRFNRTTGSFVTPNAPFKETTMGVVFSGPIVKDKLFFLANYEELKSSRSAPTFGPVGSALTNVGITSAQIAAAQETARTVWSFDAGSLDIPPGANLEVKELLLKLDWNISETHRASIRYTKTEETNPIFPAFGGTILSLNSHWYDQVKTNEALVAQWFADWTPDFTTEFKLSQRNYESEPLTKSNLPTVNLVFTGAPPPGTTGATRTLVLGTEQFRHFNRLATETLDTYVGATWNLGNHEIKFGADYVDNSIYNAFVNNTKGVYEFRGTDPVAQFAAGTPFTYSLRAPINGFTLEDGAANWTLQNLGLFAQDTWRVSRSFNLMFGVRLDRTIVDDKPIRNPGFRTDFGYDNDTTMDGKQVVQPRLGFNLNLTPTFGRRLQLRGGVGLFEGSSSNVWLTNPYQNTGVPNATLTCGGSAPACPAGLRFSPNPSQQPAIPGNTPAAAVDLISPNLRQPSLWKLNLALEAELPWAGIVATAEWVHSRVRSGINYRHLNLGAATATGSDGRPLYWNAAALGTACWNGGDALVANCGGLSRAGRNTRYTDVLIAENTKKGGGDSLTLALSGNVARSLNWTVSYTRTTATEVSPLTSSTAISNWNGRAVFNPNEEVDARSAYEVKDRITGGFSFSRNLFGERRTTLGVFYEGRRGKPYSWTFRNDANGDGIAGNDLMYVPSAPGSGEVVFFGATPAAQQANEARFWEFVNANPELSSNRGRVLSRNSDSAPWVNNWDLRFTQEFGGFAKGHKAVFGLDILNFGNLLNKRWGRIDEVGFNGGNLGGVLNRGGNARSFVNFAGISNGRYVYNTQNTVEDFNTKQDRLESQWQIQVTLRYEF